MTKTEMYRLIDIINLNPDAIPFKEGERVRGWGGRGLGTVKHLVYDREGNLNGYFVEYDNGDFHTCDVYSIGHIDKD